MGVFHWGRLVSNYGFFMGGEQCLQSRLGLVFQLVMVDREDICKNLIFHQPSMTLDPDLGSSHLVTILSCFYGLL